MSGYVSGYMYLTNIAAWRQATGSAGNDELYETTINQIPLLVPNGVTASYPYQSAGPSGIGAGKWWVTGDVSQYGAANFNDSSSPTRDLISQAYNSLFVRFPGVVATEYWADLWLYRGGQTTYGSVFSMIQTGGGNSGESQFVASTPYAIPYTLYAPRFGCTTVGASNYEAPAPLQTRLFTSPVILTGGTCTFPPPPPPPPSINSFSLSSTQICRGGTSALSWSVSGDVNSVSINQGIGNVSFSSPTPYTVNPTSTTTYTITASGSGGTTIRSIILTVKQPTSTSIVSSSPTIIRGQSTRLTWTTTGDATSASITPGIGSVNINGTNPNISPTETTTYEIIVTGVCTNSSDFVTVTVYQPPTVTISGPEFLNYNQQGILSYTTTYTDISLVVTPTYTYKNTSTSGTPINLPIGQSVPEPIPTNIVYNDFGPTSVSYLIVATGNGGQESKQITIPINIDETPQNLLIPESVDLFKSQEPIYSPEETVTSYKIIINDIDIPIEIKADKPILIDINEQDSWEQLRSIS